MKKLLKWGLLIFVVFPIVALFIMGGAGYLIGGKDAFKQPPSPTPTSTQAVAKVVPSATPTPTQQPKATPAPQYFDLPVLIGKNADGVATALKDYQKKTLQPTQEQIKLGVKDWDMEFEKDGKDLLVSYVIATKAVNNFFISTDDPSGATKDKKHLLELGNLSENDPRYKVEFVKALKDSTRFTGVKVTPR